VFGLFDVPNARQTWEGTTECPVLEVARLLDLNRIVEVAIRTRCVFVDVFFDLDRQVREVTELMLCGDSGRLRSCIGAVGDCG
jgi:hypothetical protein